MGEQDKDRIIEGLIKADHAKAVMIGQLRAEIVALRAEQMRNLRTMTLSELRRLSAN